MVLVYFTRQRLRKQFRKNDASHNSGSPIFSPEIKPANLSALHEIDNNSTVQFRELPDSGKVELLDGNSPSGSGNALPEIDNNSLRQIRELPDSGKVELLDGNSPSGSFNQM